MAKACSSQNENWPESELPAEAKAEADKPTIAQPEVLKPVDVMSTKVLPETSTARSDTVASTMPAELLAADDAPEPDAEDPSQKKRRQRQRQRNKQRQDVDMDLDELAEHEDSEKYAKWVPPSNQSGDGITHLNEKFGY